MKLQSIPHRKVADTKQQAPARPAPTSCLDDDVPRAVPHTESPAIKPPFDTKLHDFALLERRRKLEIADFEALAASPSGRLMLWAQKANRCVRDLLINGSDAAPDAKLSPDDAQALHDEMQNEFHVQLENSITQKVIAAKLSIKEGRTGWKLNTAEAARRLSEQLEKHKFGASSYQAAAAYGHLVKWVPPEILEKLGEPETLVELCEFVGGDHELVVIGRRSKSDPKDITTWGPNAVVCDPWANKVYLLSQLAWMQRPENDVKRHIGQCDDHYLKGRLQPHGKFYFASMKE